MNEIVFCKNCEKRYTQNCGLYHGTINGKEYYVENGDNFGCIYGKEKNDIKMTNYDRIKSMSVEDLTEFISNITKVVAVKLGEDYVVNDKQFIQQWLLQEVSENDI